MYKLVLFICFFILSIAHNTNAQKKITSSIDEVIVAAQSDSPSSLLAEARLDNEYWQYVAFNSTFKPQLTLSGTLPELNRSIDAITLPDGEEAFVSRSFMRSSLGLQMFQLIPKTGGSIYASSNLTRLDVFKTDLREGSNSYLSAPVTIGINQPLFQFNRFKWDKQINKLEYDQSVQEFVEEKEAIAYEAVNHFFSLYVDRLNMEKAELNKIYLDSLFEIAQGRFASGRIAETELLQVELSAKNADADIASLELDIQNQNEALRDFLGIKEEVEFELNTPREIEDYNIDPDLALEHAWKNRSRTSEFRLRLLNAEKQMDEAKKEGRPSLSLEGSFGLTQTGETFSDAYKDLLDQERVALSLNVPIADWGLSKARKEIAKSNLELTQLQLEQDEVSFEREILVSVNQFQLKRNQLKLAEEAVTIAEKRLDIAKKRYQIGKISVTDLNIAINEERQARQQYYTSLWVLWQAHYEIRNLTLYDFVEDRPIQYIRD